jgi:class 3 adenylate cyclase/tetratricopeptide (TPR) repeat protein
VTDPPNALQEALAALECFRTSLGDAAIDAAAAALRQHAPAAGAGLDAAPRLRQVSVLFADVAESTAMLARVGADEAMDLLGAAVQGFADAVRQWDGDVLRYTGDGIKASFGTRGLREDEAERAVRAGLQILADAARHAERVQRELGIAGFGVRVGVHTGPVLLGGGVEAERSAMGHAVHLAARMEQSAPVGRLRISEGTWALVRGQFVAEEQPPLIVKGHDEPLRTWLVNGVVPDAEAAVQRGLDGADAPMVGRDAELAQLLALHAQTVATRRGAIALVLGEAGIGKTRLRRELLVALGLSEGAPGLLQARAHPSSPLQPYGLLHQLLARHLDLAADLPAAAARERLLAGLAPWLPDEAPRAWVGQLIGLDFADHPAVQGLGPSGLRARACDALRDMLHAMAATRPLLLVLDDLHWADEASLAFVQTLLAPAEVPLMLLLLARPTFAERGLALELPPEPAGLRLVLEPLAAAGQALLDALLQPLADPPPALKPMLLERAQGNPLFLEALVRMLIDDGVIDTQARPWRIDAGRLAALPVPPTLVGVLQARLDALPPAERHALQAASIVGPVFWRDALAAIDAAAPAALDALQRRQLVAARPASAFAPAEEFGFVHQLLHETTYGTVLKPQRREGHARAARWLAARVAQRGGEFLAVIASHHERAGDGAQALEWWDRARQDAGRRFANEAALQFAERALAQPALDDPFWRFMLMSSRRTTLDFLGRPEAAVVLEEMAAYAEACNDDAMRATLLEHRMLEADHRGEPAAARALAHEVLACARRSGDPRAASSAALAHGELAWLAVQEHRHDEVAAQIEAGLVHARVAARVPPRHGGYAGYEQQLRTIAIESLLVQERHVDALAAIAQALAALGAEPGPYDRYNLLHRQGVALRRLGRLDEAKVLARETVELALRMGVARVKVEALHATTELARLRGDLDAAEQTLQQAELAAAATDGGFELPRVREQAGHLALARGRPEAACAAWDDAIERLRQQGRPALALQLGCERAALDLALGRPAAALAAVDAALSQAQQDGRPHWRALSPEALVAAAEVLVALGDARAAALREALRARLDEQLAAVGTPEERRLLEGVPHWRAAARLLGVGV